MSIRSAVETAANKLTGKKRIHSHHAEQLDDGSFIHTIRHESGKEKHQEYPHPSEEERHTHSSAKKLVSCILDCHTADTLKE